jgi:hypothetical protein
MRQPLSSCIRKIISVSALCSVGIPYWVAAGTVKKHNKKGGEQQMKCFTVSIYLSIETETKEEARKIACSLEVVPKNKEDALKIWYDTQNTEVEEAMF